MIENAFINGSKDMIYITHSIAINENEIREKFILASGPGGQRVNKVATAVQLRFDVRNSPSLPHDVRKRLIHLAGKRITGDGILIINARRFRKQEQNRQDAVDRLIKLIRKAAEKPEPRHKTRPTLASKKRRLNTKHHRSELKQIRQSISCSE